MGGDNQSRLRCGNCLSAFVTRNSRQPGRAMDELLAAGEVAAGQRDLYVEYQRIAAEQAALRRLATLVARGAEPSHVFDAVVKEIRQCLVTERAGLWRYEANGEITLLAADFHSPAPAKWPVGTRTPVD